MSLVVDANADANTFIIDLDPFAESDLFLIISAYEKGLRESQTEEALMISLMGEVEKNKGNTDSFIGIVGQYSEASSEKSTDGSIQAALKLGKLNGVPFADCFPCDGRISLSIDNLPHPAMFNIFKTFLDAIKDFLQKMKELLDPTNFYSDVCKLLDALRIVCPQDLIILLALLTWLLSYYVTLSFDIDLDWTSILALLLLPILLLIHTLLQLAINVGLGPIDCLFAVISVVRGIVNSGKTLALTAKNSVETSLASVKDLEQETVGLFGGSDSGQGSSGKTEENPGLSSNTQSPEEEKATIGDSPKGGLLHPDYKSIIGKLKGIEVLLVGIRDIQLTLREILKRFADAIQACMDLLSAGLVLRMQLMGAIVQLIRLIGFLKALIKGLTDGSICKDPSQPLSTSDIQSLINTINGQSSLSGKTDPNPTTAIIGLQLDTATGNLIVTDRIKDQSTTVPTCLSSISDDDRVKIQQWIQDLEKAA